MEAHLEILQGTSPQISLLLSCLPFHLCFSFSLSLLSPSIFLCLFLSLFLCFSLSRTHTLYYLEEATVSLFLSRSLALSLSLSHYSTLKKVAVILSRSSLFTSGPPSLSLSPPPFSLSLYLPLTHTLKYLQEASSNLKSLFSLYLCLVLSLSLCLSVSFSLSPSPIHTL